MEYKSKIIQFGEGNFLRAFIEEYIYDANNCGYDGKVVICQPRTNNKTINVLKKQDCKYDIVKRGYLNNQIIDERIEITSVSECIDVISELDLLIESFCCDDLQMVVSNTTEAGIYFNDNDKYGDYHNISFPAKLTYLSYLRYKQNKSGLVFLPCELIENNGITLRKSMLKYADIWNLDISFCEYLNNECSCCNTLVDRIVTGHNPSDTDPCSVNCEPYRLFIIDCDKKAKKILPFNDSSVIFTDKLPLYRERKVKILNGIHTMMCPYAFLNNFDIVRDAVNDKKISDYIAQGVEEIKKTIDFNENESEEYYQSVLNRFSNPYIDHKISDILLNSISKFKSRVLTSIIDYCKIFGNVPDTLCKSFAYLIAYYNHKSEKIYQVNDIKTVLEFFEDKPTVKQVLSNKDFWDFDLTQIEGLTEKVEYYYDTI